jgi:hypothetical protein
MGANRMILEKIILIISITVLVAGFYFCSFHDGNSGETVKTAAGETKKDNPMTKNNNSIDLVRPAFLDK